MLRQCFGPLHKGALLSSESYDKDNVTCNLCLTRSRQWKAANKDKLKELDSWDRPENRLRQNLRRLGWNLSEKKEQLTPLLKPGMGWPNFYVKGKRSWKFELGLTNDGWALVPTWSNGRISSGIALAEK